MTFIALAFLLAAAPASAAPAPETQSYLRELGLDPASQSVLAVSTDAVTAVNGEVYTLDSLAAKRDEKGVRAFLVTRGFVHAFRADPAVQFPDDERYDIKYQSVEERRYIARKLMEGMPRTSEPAKKAPKRKKRK